jgi:NAD(P)H-dependent FMN reductase
MHDGYIFTIGICGSASDSGLAPACLDALLAALPPVKRAALLGEVMVFAGEPDLGDPMVDPIRADIADAELLLIATPVSSGGLPARLRALARAVAASPPPARPRFAALVAVGRRDDSALAPMRALCAAAGAAIVGELWLGADDALGDDARQQLGELAREAYGQARGLRPEALPQ